jgi:hypothetical protein
MLIERKRMAEDGCVRRTGIVSELGKPLFAFILISSIAFSGSIGNCHPVNNVKRVNAPMGRRTSC